MPFNHFSIIISQTKFFSLEIQDGYLRLLYDFGFTKGPVLLDDSMKKAQINDARFHEVCFYFYSILMPLFPVADTDLLFCDLQQI